MSKFTFYKWFTAREVDKTMMKYLGLPNFTGKIYDSEKKALKDSALYGPGWVIKKVEVIIS